MNSTTTGGLCDVLDWDSEWFGVRVARLREPRLNQETLQNALSWCGDQQVDCLYFLAGLDDFETLRLAAEAGFVPVDIRVTLSQLLEPQATEPSGPVANVRLFRPEDRRALKTIAGRLHTHSRFFFDVHFDRSKAKAMYERWFERCVENRHGWILVAEHESKPAAYSACELLGNHGRITLFGVADSAQGKGLGSTLLEATLAKLRQSLASSVSVVTQLRHLRSVQLYQKHGFRVAALQQWYHKWFERQPANPASSRRASA